MTSGIDPTSPNLQPNSHYCKASYLLNYYRYLHSKLDEGLSQLQLDRDLRPAFKDGWAKGAPLELVSYLIFHFYFVLKWLTTSYELQYFTLHTEDFLNKLYSFITYDYFCCSVVAHSLNFALVTNTVSRYFCFDTLSYCFTDRIFCIRTESFVSRHTVSNADIITSAYFHVAYLNGRTFVTVLLFHC